MANKPKKKPMTPREAKTDDEICALPRDNVDTEEHWMLLDGDDISLAAQRSGEGASANIKLPRAVFEAFIDWYNTGKWKKPRRKRKPKPQ